MTRKRIFFLVILSIFLTMSWTSCTKMKYGDFTIRSIELIEMNANTTNNVPLLYFDCSGPGLSDITDKQTLSDPNGTLVYATSLHGTRGSAKYTIKLMEDTGSQQNEVTSMVIDFGDYKGQKNFTLSEGDIQVRFSMDWEARW